MRLQGETVEEYRKRNKEYQRRWRKTAKGRASSNASVRRYQKTPKGRLMKSNWMRPYRPAARKKMQEVTIPIAKMRGQRWTISDEQLLIQLSDNGILQVRIAERLKRTWRGIERRLTKLRGWEKATK